MDTSETYIKMCEKAEEIQESFKHSCNYQDAIVWRNNRVPTYLWRVAESNLEHEPYSEHFIWLPYQDQLQGMIEMEYPYNINFFQQWAWEKLDFVSGYEQRPCFKFTSMEQLWLAFVMKEKYNKIWNGEEWNEMQLMR